MASLFAGLSTPGGAPPPPAADAADAGGGGLFSGLGVASSEQAASGGGFGFIGSAQQEPAPSSGFGFLNSGSTEPAAPSGSSGFGFLNSAAPAEEATASTSSGFGFLNSSAPDDTASSGLSAFGFMSSTAHAAPAAAPAAGFDFTSNPAPAVSTAPATTPATQSLFSFLGEPSEPTLPSPSPPPRASLDVFGSSQAIASVPASASFTPASANTFTPAHASTIPAGPPPVRKKTRKAMLPGHAAKAAESADADVSPSSPEAPPPPELPPPPEEPPAPPAPEVPAPAPPPPAEPVFTPVPRIAEEGFLSPRSTRMQRSPRNALPVATEQTPPPPPPPPQTDMAAFFAKNAHATPDPHASPRLPSPQAPPPPPDQGSKDVETANSTESAQSTGSLPQASGGTSETDLATTFCPPPPPIPAKPELHQATAIDGVLLWLEDKSVTALEQQKDLLEQQSTCLAASQRSSSDVVALRQKLAATEADQNRRCDNEQFEEAATLDATIQELKDSITVRLEEVATLSRQMEGLAQSLLDTTKERETFVSASLERTSVLQSENEQALEDHSTEDEKQLAQQTARLERERKRMDLARSHLEKDSANLEEENRQLQDAIHGQTSEHDDERTRAIAQRSAIDEEIQLMQMTLEAKIRERAELSETVGACEIRVASIKSKFEKQLSRLESKRKRLEETQREVDSDEEQVEQIALQLTREQEVAACSASTQTKRIADIAAEARRLDRMRRLAAKHFRMRDMWQEALAPILEVVNQARISWERAASESSTLSASLSERETEAAKLRSQIDAIQTQLPSLEASKKLAVSSRSFKEAGRIAEEIRRKDEDRKNFEAELQKLEEADLSESRDALNLCRQSEERLQAELLEAEAQGATEQVRVMRRQALDLERLCRNPLMSDSERALLEQEVALQQAALQHLATKHGLDVESLDEIPAGDYADLEDDDPTVEELAAEGSPAPETPTSGGDVVQKDETPAIDIGETKRRIAELSVIESETEAEIQIIEQQIEASCEAEEFDKAEDLENDRKSAEERHSAAKNERGGLEASLAAAEAAAAEGHPAAENEPGPSSALGFVGNSDESTEVDGSGPSSVFGFAGKSGEGEVEASGTAPSSGFGFVGGSVPEEAEPGEAAPSSGFGFVSGTGAEDTAAGEAAPSSGFGFVGGSSPAEAESGEAAPSSGFGFVGGTGAEDAEAGEAAPSSGFVFVGESGADKAEAGESAPSSTVGEAAPSSGFGFVGKSDADGAAGTPEAAAPEVATPEAAIPEAVAPEDLEGDVAHASPHSVDGSAGFAFVGQPTDEEHPGAEGSGSDEASGAVAEAGHSSGFAFVGQSDVVENNRADGADASTSAGEDAPSSGFAFLGAGVSQTEGAAAPCASSEGDSSAAAEAAATSPTIAHDGEEPTHDNTAS